MVKKWFHWLLSLIVLLAAALPSAGLLAGAIHGSRAEAAPVPASLEPRTAPLWKTAFLPRNLVLPLPAESPAPAPPKPEPAAPVPAPPETSVLRYETTAYFLNVRSGPGKDYDILRTVKQGTILDIEEKTGNGWLRLEGEGYVHGAYVRPVPQQKVSPPEPGAERIAVASAEAAASSESGQAEPDPPAKPTSSVRSDSGLDEQDIKAILQGTELEGHDLESAILEIEDEFGINAFFTIAVMKLESGNGKSRLAKSKNNLFGLNATGGSNRNAYRFDSKADSVRKFGQIISRNYIGKGYTTVEKVARKYCPANDQWPKLVKTIMNGDVKKLII